MNLAIVPVSVSSEEKKRIESEMTETLEFSPETVAPLLLSVGQQLRAAREAKGLAASDIAKTLKLSPRQVVALEADDWSNLPCNTIIRGFVRNYARLLNLNPDLLMSSLDALKMPEAPELKMAIGTPVGISQESKADRRDYVRVFSGLIILLLAVLAYFFYSQELWLSTLSVMKAATQSNEVVVEKAVEPVQEVVKSPEPEVASPASSVLENGADAPLQAVAASAAVPVSQATSGNALKFNFTQPSWVEVRDGNGGIIFSQLSQAGSQREIEGRPPFTLVIGNATHVTLQYKGKSVDLSKRSKEDVARLTLE